MTKLPNKPIGSIVHFYDGDHEKLGLLPGGTQLPKIGWYWMDAPGTVVPKSEAGNPQFEDHWDKCPYNPEEYPDWFSLELYVPSFEELEYVSGYHLSIDNTFEQVFDVDKNYYNVFPTEKEAKSSRARAQLSQIASWVNSKFTIDEEEPNDSIYFTVEPREGKLYTIGYSKEFKPLIYFLTEEAANLSLKKHKLLWKQFWMLAETPFLAVGV